MPQFTELYVNKPTPHKLTISPDNYFNIFVYYEMRGAGGGAGGGHSGSSFVKGGDGWFGTKVIGQMILKPGDVLYLCPGEGGKSGRNNADSGEGFGTGGKGVEVVAGKNFAGGPGGGAFGSYGAGGGGGGASVIILDRDNEKLLAAIAAGGGGGGGGGTDPSITSNYPYIGSLTNSQSGGGKGQDHYDASPYFKNYRNGNYLGRTGPGAGGGGAGALRGNGGLIGFDTTSSAPGSGGTSFGTKIKNLKTAAMLTDPYNAFVTSVTFLDSEFGGQGALASNDANTIGSQGDNGYINILMFPINTIRIKENSTTWGLPDLILTKGNNRWESVKKVILKRGESQWNVVYDTEIRYDLKVNDSSQYTYVNSSTPAIEKEASPDPLTYQVSSSKSNVYYNGIFSIFVDTTGIPLGTSLSYTIAGMSYRSNYAEINLDGSESYDLNEIITLGAVKERTFLNYGDKRTGVRTRIDYRCKTYNYERFVFNLIKIDGTEIRTNVAFNEPLPPPPPPPPVPSLDPPSFTSTTAAPNKSVASPTTWQEWLLYRQGLTQSTLSSSDSDFGLSVSIGPGEPGCVTGSSPGTDTTCDASADSGDDGDCYLTTAATQYANLEDDCKELTYARHLREIARSKNSKNEQLIKLYYKIAPLLVNRKHDWKDFFESTMIPMTKHYESGRYDSAMKTYIKETAILINQYITTKDKDIINYTFDSIFKMPKVPYIIKCAVLKTMLYFTIYIK